MFNFVNDSLGVEEHAGIKCKLGHITHGHHVPNINICNTLNLLKNLVTRLLKRLAFSQEMPSCLRLVPHTLQVGFTANWLNTALLLWRVYVPVRRQHN